MLIKAFIVSLLSLMLFNPIKIFSSDSEFRNENSKEVYQTKGFLSNYFDDIKFKNIKEGDIILLNNTENPEVFIYKDNGIASKVENGNFSYDVDVRYMVDKDKSNGITILRFDVEKFTHDIQNLPIFN